MAREFSPHDFDDPRSEPAGDPSLAGARLEDRVPTDRALRESEVSERAQEAGTPEARSTRGRTIFRDRESVYRLNDSGMRTLVELGKFRVIATHDLIEHAYLAHPKDARRDIANLVRQGLVRKDTFAGPEWTPREILTLTRRGHRLLRANRLVREQQAIYHGFVQPREANHDADLYRVYQREAARIEAEGGRSLRVVLEYELKRDINRDIAHFGEAAREEIAARHGLRVVYGKIPLPDMRIEYETREGQMARVNLELVTEHYGSRRVAEKVRAGFSLYAPSGEAGHLRRVLDQHAPTADFLSL
jgi:hypothetical protein